MLWAGSARSNVIGASFVPKARMPSPKADVVDIGERRHLDGHTRENAKSVADGERRTVHIIWNRKLRPITAVACAFARVNQIIAIAGRRNRAAGVQSGNGQM